MRNAGFTLSWVLKVTLAAMLGIIFFKWIFSKIQVPGLSRAVNAV